MTPSQIPLGDETPRKNPLASAASLTPTQLSLGKKPLRNKEELLLGDETLGTKGELPLRDKTPGTTTTTMPNLRGCGRKTTTSRIMDTARTMVIKDNGRTMVITTKTTTKKTPNPQGCGERRRLFLQISRMYFYVFRKPSHPFNIVRELKRQIKSNRVSKKAGTGRVGQE